MDFAAIRAKAVSLHVPPSRALFSPPPPLTCTLSRPHLQEQAATAARAQLQRPSPPSRYASSSSTTNAAPPSYRPPLAAAAAAPPLSSRRPPQPAATQADKDALFSALDEVRPFREKRGQSASLTRALALLLPQFFSSRLGIQLQPPAPAPAPAPAPPRVAPKPARRRTPIAVPEAVSQPAPVVAPAPKPSGPPPISRATRPQLSPALAPAAPRPSRSYPPPETHSSAALSLLHWLLDPPDLSSVVTSAFFLPPPASPSPQPPPLENRSDVRSAYSWLQRGHHKSYVGCFLFGDASIAWIRISWNAAAEARGPTDLLSQVQREGRYRPRPRIETNWDAERLYRASETYGPRIVRFAQDALARGVPVARGECWDLANEAIAACEADKIGGAPFPSIARTHGALLYYARADTGSTLGTWTGGDVYVRPGDIVEWRSVTIREVGMAPGSYSTLGDPEVRFFLFSLSLSFDPKGTASLTPLAFSTRPSSLPPERPSPFLVSPPAADRSSSLPSSTRPTPSQPSSVSPSSNNLEAMHRPRRRTTWRPCPREKCGSIGRAD